MNNVKKTVLITGSSGLIGQHLCNYFQGKCRVIAFDTKSTNSITESVVMVRGRIEDPHRVAEVCNTYQPEIVIHCAGIAHQKLNSSLTPDDYDNINNKAAILVANKARESNPDMHFIFLSSVSVYGEKKREAPISEVNTCHPTTPYAKSKLKAETQLIKMYKENQINRLDILRLAPIYTDKWNHNLKKRVMAPIGLCYLKFGSGRQKISALSSSNLALFIRLLLGNECPRFLNLYNVTDRDPYSFNEIIGIYKRSPYQPFRVTLTIPLVLLKIGVMFLAFIFPRRADWILSCYNKLAYDLVFDNRKMLETGFLPSQRFDTVHRKDDF